MKKELTIEHLAAYLPYGVSTVGRSFLPPHDPEVKKRNGLTLLTMPNDCKLLLRPLSQLTETIEHGGEMFVPIEYFEIGDGDNDSHEYGYGNIKLINTLKSISEHEGWQDCDFLPNGVVRYLHSLHFDTFGLIEAGLAETIPSIPQP